MISQESHYSDVLLKIGDLLRRKRLLKGEKIKTIATELGVSDAVISRIENGRYNLSVVLLLKLCEYYGVSPQELLPITTGANSSKVRTVYY